MSSEWGAGDPLYLMVAVKDTGIGISKDGQTQLFERFRQATPKTQENYGGSGLGLFISRKLCQLHGGDIGVSSKEGEGSTFGFFFKVRRSDGSSHDGRPPFQSRSNSESSQQSNQGQNAQPPQQRPGYARANSNLTQIKERQNERPQNKTLSSHDGVRIKQDMDECLRNPPTEYIAEAHPNASSDERYKVTEDVAKDIQPDRAGVSKTIEQQMPHIQRGETKRQAKAANEHSRSKSDERSEDKQTLLLVEDNIINQKVLRRQLQSRGFEVFTASNGQEAIDMVAERGKISPLSTTDRNFFDIILMDQEMPVKDGNVATQEIRQLQDAGKAGYSHILGVSANVREAQTQSMREAGMDDIISKPFKVDDLVKRIQSIILEEKPGKAEAATNSPPAEDTGADKEVQMLEDVTMRSRSEQSRFEKGEGGDRGTGGSATVELVDKDKGEDQKSKSREKSERAKEEADIKGDKEVGEILNMRDGSRQRSEKEQGSEAAEEQEDRDRRAGQAGRLSGREGEARGGERSRSRRPKGK